MEFRVSFCSSLKLLLEILATFSACSCITKNVSGSKSVEALILLGLHFPRGEGESDQFGSYQ